MMPTLPSSSAMVSSAFGLVPIIPSLGAGSKSGIDRNTEGEYPMTLASKSAWSWDRLASLETRMTMLVLTAYS
jgi:hypothetical protein